MNTYIALLRGINVGGHKKVPMAELRSQLEKVGFANVRTYIQSGNVILQSSETNHAKIEEKIKQAILDYFGFEVPVIVRTKLELQSIFDNCPFSKAEKEQSYFTILSQKPEAELVKIAREKVYPNETYKIIDDCIYFYSALPYGRVKFNNNFFERKLKVSATARNYKTMVKLLELAG